VSIVGIVSAGLAVAEMAALNHQVQVMKRRHLDAVAALNESQRGLLERFVYKNQLDHDALSRADARSAIAGADAMTDHGIAEYRSIVGDAHHDLVAAFTAASTTYRGLLNSVVFDIPIPAGVPVPASGEFEPTFKASEKTMIGVLYTLIKQERTDAGRAIVAAQAAYHNSVATIIVVFTAGLAIALLIGMVIIRRIVGSLRSVSGALAAMSEGDLTRTLPITSNDELADMARSLNAATKATSQAVLALASSANELTSSSSDLRSVSDQVSDRASNASGQTAEVASAVETVLRDINTVAAGSEEISASIGEIARSASEGARVAAQAVDVAGATNDTVTKLGQSSAEIGFVVKTITSIAEQTNLLALNATIEAARAGDAGKGFAVVAGEVKDLAQETAKATDDISSRVKAIQEDTQSAVQAISQISEIIAQISDYQTTIAAAMEQQNATTTEMSRNVAHAAAGSSTIAVNVGGLAEAASATATDIGRSRRAAAHLTELSATMQSIVAKFQY
jgi:methyl-accepting chemotaxis protein